MKKLISIRSVEISVLRVSCMKRWVRVEVQLDIWGHWSRTKVERQQFMVLMGIGSLKMEPGRSMGNLFKVMLMMRSGLA